MILSKYLENNECVSSHSFITNYPETGIFSSEITLDDEYKIINVNTGSVLPRLSYASLSGNDYTIKITKNSLKFWFSNDTVERIKLDVTITEEWFFQLCTLHDFGSLRYSDIEFLRDVFNKLCTGE
jgi:hypothetical protein